LTRLIFLLVVLFLAWRVLRAFLAPPSARRATRRREDPGWDPYAVLGVPPGASGVEITQAYRERLKEYHPDRVASLGPELRELAHRKTVEIQRAWDALRPKRGAART
jgi:preprotein translocase subunit Sec63